MSQINDRPLPPLPDPASFEPVVLDHPVRVEDLDTPCLLVDVEVARRNIRRADALCREKGLRHRPHLKTSRCDFFRRLQTDGDGPCTVATMAEAEAHAVCGARDILLAVGIAPHLFPRAARLLSMGVDLRVVLDSPAMARALADFGKAHGVVFEVALEIDCDGHRAGLSAESPALIGTATVLAEGGQKIAGVITHAGAAYNLRDPGAIADLAVTEAAAARGAARRLREAGFDCPIVSVGSTPTLVLGPADRSVYEGVTEFRSGVNVFNDLVMHGLGCCGLEDLALTVLVSVIGGFEPELSDGSPVRFVTDGGWSALSSDRGLAWRFDTWGYGLARDVHGKPLEGVRVRDLNQEHAMLEADPGTGRTRDFLAGMRPGTKVGILPQHACAAMRMHRCIHLVENGVVSRVIPLVHGW